MFLARRSHGFSAQLVSRGLASKLFRWTPKVVAPVDPLPLSTRGVSSFDANKNYNRHCCHAVFGGSSWRGHHSIGRRDVNGNNALTSTTRRLSSLRPFSTTGSDGGGNDDKDFFLHDEDSLPQPPSYIRDATTGKWTGETHAELSSKDRKLLKADDDAKGDELVNRLQKQWESAAHAAEDGADRRDDGLGTLSPEHERVARRIREQQLALGPIGRDPSLSSDVETPLTKREYDALKGYAHSQHGVHPGDIRRLDRSDPDLLPHRRDLSSGADDPSSEASAATKQFFDPDLDLAHLDPRLDRAAFRDTSSEYEDVIRDDPFADLLPSDLNPARKVNRRHAKPLPKRAMHHNNLALLRRYTTPGGKIMNRVQSRLGAKDQRKVAKLIKRARHLGLIPHLGQWKFEDHGYLHEKGLRSADDDGDGKRDWEVELEKRGLWPLKDEKEVVGRRLGVDKILDFLGNGRDGHGHGQVREELEDLLNFGSKGWEKRQKGKGEEQKE
ncbi:hypothetical protein ACHAXS_005606 [Conticribra weissflogii]